MDIATVGLVMRVAALAGVALVVVFGSIIAHLWTRRSDLPPLQSDETIVCVVHRHWVVFALDVLRLSLLAASPFVMYALVRVAGIFPAPLAPWSTLLTLAGGLWLVIVLVTGLATITVDYLDEWVVTNRRVLSVEQVSLFSRTVATWRLEHVEEIMVEKEGILASLFDYGMIKIQTAGQTDSYEHMTTVPHPEAVRDLMMQHIDTLAGSHHPEATT